MRRWCCRTPGVCGTAYRPAACAGLISFWSGHRRLRGCRSIRSNTSHTRCQIRKSKHCRGGQRVAYFVATQRDPGQNQARGDFVLVYPAALLRSETPVLQIATVLALCSVCRTVLLAHTCSRSLQARTSTRDISTVLQVKAPYPDMSQKRHFPYYSAVPEIEIKKRRVSGVNPGREYVDPRTFVPGSQYSTAPVQGSEVC